MGARQLSHNPTLQWGVWWKGGEKGVGSVDVVNGSKSVEKQGWDC